LPDGMADEVAVFMEPAACVLRGVRHAAVEPRGTAVVQGAGGMGLLHLLVLRALHPELRVMVTDPIEERRLLATTLGADAAASPGEEAHLASMNISDGLGADAVFDTVGGAPLLDAALALSRRGGTVVMFAHAPDGERATFDLNALFKREQRLLGSYSGGLEDQSRVFSMMLDGKLDPSPLVSHRLALVDFDSGVDIARRRQALKILFAL